MESHQPSGSFKIRGIGHLCTQYAQQGCKGFVSSSGGNAGLAVAYGGKTLMIPTTVFVPKTTPMHVRERMRDLNAVVLEHGEVWDECDVYARAYAQHHGMAYIHPFDDPAIWEGHASIIHELQKQIAKPDLIICSVGGGGLLCGIAEGLWQCGWKDVPIAAIETKGAASLQASVEADTLIEIERIRSIAKTLGARKVAAKALEWTRKHPISCIQVSDQQTVHACLDILDTVKVLVEPACSASYAVLDTDHPLINSAQCIVVVLCGGSGVDYDTLTKWKQDFFPTG